MHHSGGLAPRERGFVSCCLKLEFGRLVGWASVRQEAGAIGWCKSSPGKVQHTAWKRVLREPVGNGGREAYTVVAWGV